VHFDALTPPEQRVLGCLLEKLNALRLACNQSTNRDPVTQYDESTVHDAAQRLCKYGIVRLASGHSSRAVKYRHLAEEALGLDRQQLAVLAVLLLRGPQTPGELKARTERMATIESLEQVENVLDALGARGYMRCLGRRPGQKEDRFEQLLGGEGVADDAGPEPSYTAPVHAPVDAPVRAPVDAPVRAPADAPVPSFAPPTSATASSSLERRVAQLEREVAELRAELRQWLS
jgi:uncharacterized protein YceH (UPF0502 family)